MTEEETKEGEAQDIPKELVPHLRAICEYLNEHDIHSAVLGVPNGKDGLDYKVHSLAVVYQGPLGMEDFDIRSH